MYTPEHNTKVSGSALLPFAVFIVIYLGAGLIQQARGVQMAFYQFPSVTAMFFAVITAFAMTREPFNKSIHIFSRGASKEDVITMLLIYVLAGAFSAVAGAMGGRDATVNLGLSVIAPQLPDSRHVHYLRFHGHRYRHLHGNHWSDRANRGRPGR